MDRRSVQRSERLCLFSNDTQVLRHDLHIPTEENISAMMDNLSSVLLDIVIWACDFLRPYAADRLRPST